MSDVGLESNAVQRLARILRAELIETHISWVLLTDDLAYKLKKPVRLGFVDYSTPQKRQHYCEEEVRLNARFSPSLYLGVSQVTGTPDAPAIDGSGPVIDYAVRMRRFPSGALFSERLAAGTLTEDAAERLGARVASFHEAAPAVREGVAPRERQRIVLATLDGASAVLGPRPAARLLDWILRESESLLPLMRSRVKAGRVRECHGDLHLANVLELGGEIAAFDCIEFDPALRRIDVVEDAAFALMDFCARGQAGLGWRFFNAWLEATGDHDALPALRLAVVGRALVRAQVEHLRSPHSSAAHSYARTAQAWSGPVHPGLTITSGLPGSGKTFAARRLLQAHGAICIRSDVERKRLADLPALADSRAAGLDLYTPEMTRRTYARLFDLARGALRAGFPVILDAAFLRFDERRMAHELAQELRVPYVICACEAPVPVLRERLLGRRGDASEADAAVLDALRTTAELLRPEELGFVIRA